MELRVFGGKNDDKFWADKPMQKNHPKHKGHKTKLTQIWNIIWNNKPIITARTVITSKTIKEDLQKIIDKDGFISDIQEYINEL